MKLFRAGVMFPTTITIVSCSIDYSSVVEDWKKDGWRVAEEYGEIGEYSHYTELKSDRAKAVEVIEPPLPRRTSLIGITQPN